MARVRDPAGYDGQREMILSHAAQLFAQRGYACLRVDMRGEISALHKRLENTMIYVTHDQVEAMTMADKIAVLRLGELEQFGAPLDLFNNPRNLFVAGFIGSPKMNFLTGQVHSADRSLLS